ncbi:MAG: C-terminal binding protein [Chloroflexi bacterium]|nr:C-terminal binding protein [Chloroflexota bacterium]
MRFKVVQVTDPPGSIMPDYGEMLGEAGIDVEFAKADCATEDEIIAVAHDADAVIGVATFQRFSRKVIEGLGRCRLIVSIGIGFDHLDIEAATQHGILSANVPDFCLEEVSDHTMALILACTRRIIELDKTVKEGGWKREPDPDIQQAVWPTMSHLRDQALGLIGFGRIAQALVPKARGFGMRIIAHDPYVGPGVIESLHVDRVELGKLLAEADIVSIHTPLTAETGHLLGLEEFKKMKPTAYLINTARGGIIDQGALCTALDGGFLAGAALDVSDPEPIDPNDPLLRMDNVIVTAHSAGISPSALAELMRRPVDEIARVIKGEWPVGLIDPKAKVSYRQKWG